MKKQYYQGDIPLIKGIELPKNLKWKKLEKELVVAEGEITNHFHTIVLVKDAQIDYAQFLNEWYLNIKKGQAVITHPEHKQITLDKGIYFVGKQYEYSDLNEYRQIKD